MKLAILGAGMIVKDFLSMVGDIPEIELKAIVGTEQDMENMEKYKSESGIEQIYTDLDKCLAECDVNTVYVALPNHLHCSYALKALKSGKNVICEKPFTLSLDEMLELKEEALSRNLVLLEAITNQYLSNYREIKKAAEEIGKLKIIECNYSQYSSRYDLFKEGTVLPAFNPEMGGGALMDINIYNIHFVAGLLGMPDRVQYAANIERGIDTSGVLILIYPDTKAVCIGAKDSTAEIRSTIQGDKGSVTLNGPTNIVDHFEKKLNHDIKTRVDVKIHRHRMYEEFKEFSRVIKEHDMNFMQKQLEHSQQVMQIVDLALKDAGIRLG
ncbi:Gfo/Idh/MocA family oxidoreductase [Lachnospiraceae bacterium 54-53]